MQYASSVCLNNSILDNLDDIKNNEITYGQDSFMAVCRENGPTFVSISLGPVN